MKTNICAFVAKGAQATLIVALSFFPCFANAQSTPPGPKPLDGVNIEAVELYPNPKEHSLGVGLGVYPFNAYYMGFLLNGSYITHFDPSIAWEVINGSYAYSVQNNLTTDLADRHGVNPKTITRLNLLVSTTGHFTLLNGKFVLLQDYIKYFRMSAIAGIGLAMTNQASSIAPQLGLRTEVVAGDGYSWCLDVRDTIAISTATNYVTFVSVLNIGL